MTMLRSTGVEAMGRFGAGVRIFAALWLPFILVLSHRNLPWVLGVLSMGGAAALWHMRLERWVWIVYGLLAYMALTVLWSPYEKAMGWVPYLALIGISVTGAMVSYGAKSARIFLYAALIAIVLLGIEGMTGGVFRDIIPPPNRPDKDDVASARGITEMIALAPAAFLFAYRLWGMRALLVLGVLVLWAGASFGVAANLLAVLASGMAAMLAHRWPRLALNGIIIAFAAGILLMPVLGLLLPSAEVIATWEFGPLSWRMRLVAWTSVTEAMGQDGAALIFGHGIESARLLGKQLGDLQMAGADILLPYLSSHPHNVFLQIWYEFGLIGASLCAMILYGAKNAVLRVAAFPGIAMAVAALLAGTFVFAMVEMSLWTLWRVIAPLLGAWLILCVAKLSATKNTL